MGENRPSALGASPALTPMKCQCQCEWRSRAQTHTQCRLSREGRSVYSTSGSGEDQEQRLAGALEGVHVALDGSHQRRLWRQRAQEDSLPSTSAR